MLALLCALEVGLQAGFGAAGERQATVAVRQQEDGRAWSLEAGSEEAPGAGRRASFSLSGELAAGPVELLGAARAVPSVRADAEAGVRFRDLSLVLKARRTAHRLGELNGAGARVEVEHGLTESWTVGGGAEAWLLSLRAPASADPWGRFSQATLDWADRGSADAWASVDLGSWSLAPSIETSSPAAGGLGLRGALAVEARAGPFTLRVEGALQHLLPEGLWLYDASLGLSWRGAEAESP